MPPGIGSAGPLQGRPARFGYVPGTWLLHSPDQGAPSGGPLHRREGVLRGACQGLTPRYPVARGGRRGARSPGRGGARSRPNGIKGLPGTAPGRSVPPPCRPLRASLATPRPGRRSRPAKGSTPRPGRHPGAARAPREPPGSPLPASPRSSPRWLFPLPLPLPLPLRMAFSPFGKGYP